MLPRCTLHLDPPKTVEVNEGNIGVHEAISWVINSGRQCPLGPTASNFNLIPTEGCNKDLNYTYQDPEMWPSTSTDHIKMLATGTMPNGCVHIMCVQQHGLRSLDGKYMVT